MQASRQLLLSGAISNQIYDAVTTPQAVDSGGQLTILESAINSK